MDSTSPVPALCVLMAALATAHVLNRRWSVPATATTGRHAAIDGLRGYLALLVFVHHACLWYFYLHSGDWKMPAGSALYDVAGRAGVAMFFMVTGFLFSSKLIDSRGRGVDWLRLYASRLTRLTPLYLVAIGIMGLMALTLSPRGLEARVPWSAALDWAAFSIPGQPDLFELPRTHLLIAGVTWTLQYEWAFYFLLPTLALLMRRRVGAAVVAASLIALAGFAAVGWRPLASMGAFFATGLLAAVLVRHAGFTRFARTPAASWLALAALALTLAGTPARVELPRLLLLPAVFFIVAGGNSLCGLLTMPAARLLGEVSYGLYLLHGLLLSATLAMLLGGPGARASSLSASTHWWLVIALTPLLVGVALVAHHLVERPAMRRTDQLTRMLRRLQRAVVPPRLQP